MLSTEASDWYTKAKLGDMCCSDTRCEHCEPSGNCDLCNTIDGRGIEAVNEYASTCDCCSKLTIHEEMTMDTVTQLGYCAECVASRLSPEILARLEPETPD